MSCSPEPGATRSLAEPIHPPGLRAVRARERGHGIGAGTKGCGAPTPHQHARPPGDSGNGADEERRLRIGIGATRPDHHNHSTWPWSIQGTIVIESVADGLQRASLPRGSTPPQDYPDQDPRPPGPEVRFGRAKQRTPLEAAAQAKNARGRSHGEG